LTRTELRIGSTVTTRNEGPGPSRTLSACVVAVLKAIADSGNASDAAMSSDEMDVRDMAFSSRSAV
jgi:hypothetical protein